MSTDTTDDLFNDHGCELIEDSLVGGSPTELNCRNETNSDPTEVHGALLKCLISVRQMLDFGSLCDWSKVLETANFLRIDSADSFEQFCSDFADYRLQIQSHCSRRIQRYHTRKQEYKIAFLGEDEISDGEGYSLLLWRDTLESVSHGSKAAVAFSDDVQPVGNTADGSSTNFTLSGKQREAYSFLLSFRDSLIFQAWLLQERKEALRAINAMVDYVAKGKSLDHVAKSMFTGVTNVDSRLADMTERLLHLETENPEENCLVREESSIQAESTLSADKCQQTENSCSQDELDEGRLLSQLQDYLKRNMESNVADDKKANGVVLSCNVLDKLRDLFNQRWTENENRLLKQIEELDAQLKAKEKHCKDCDDKVARIKDDFELQLRAMGRQLEAAKKFIVEQTTEHEEERQEYVDQLTALRTRLEEGVAKELPEDSRTTSADPPSSESLVESLKEDLDLARATEEKLNNKIAQLQWTIDAISGEAEALKEERASLIARADEAASVESSLRATINELRTEKWKLGQRNDELHCEKSLLSQQIHALMLEKSHLESTIDEMKLQNGHEEEEERVQLLAELSTLKLREKEWTSREKDLKKELQACKNNLLEKADFINQLTDEYHGDDDIDDIALLRRRLKDKRDEADQLQTTLSQMQVHIVAVKDVQKAYEGQKSMNEILRQSLADKKNEIDSYKTKIQDLEQVLDQNLEEKEKLSATILSLNEVVTAKTSMLDQLSLQFQQWKENAQAQYDDTCRKYNREAEQLRDCLKARLDMKEEDGDSGGLWDMLTTAGRHFILEAFKANLTAAEFEKRLGKGDWCTAGFLLPSPCLCNKEKAGHIAPSGSPQACNSFQNEHSRRLATDEFDSQNPDCGPADTTKQETPSWRVKMLKSEIQLLRDFNNRLMNNLAAANEGRLRDQSRHDREIRSVRDNNLHLNKLLANERNSVAELQLKMDLLVQELLECRARCCETTEEYNKLSRQTEASMRRYDLLHREAIRVISALNESYNEEILISRKVQKERDVLLSEVLNLRREGTDVLTDWHHHPSASSAHCDCLTSETAYKDLPSVRNCSTRCLSFAQACHRCDFSAKEHLNRMKSACSSLIDQKQYLLRRLAQLEDTERQLKAFLWSNGAYKAPVRNAGSHGRFKSVVIGVLFLNRLRSKLNGTS